jgi:hypothetical protein
LPPLFPLLPLLPLLPLAAAAVAFAACLPPVWLSVNYPAARIPRAFLSEMRAFLPRCPSSARVSDENALDEAL